VDIENATYTNTIGAVELKTVWTDPEFNPSYHAFYYARLLEIPTPRWTTIQAHQLGITPPDGVMPATVQERAWSSPIWYTPSTVARKNAKPGLTVGELRKEGAVALDDTQLKKLIVGKSIWMRNGVTGEQSEFFADNAGQCVVYHINSDLPQPSDIGNLALSGYLGTSTAYLIRDGRMVTSLAGTPFEFTLYKIGNKYIAARTNEFGYANYEVIKPPVNLVKLAKGRAAVH
jgi:hypothetical protein